MALSLGSPPVAVSDCCVLRCPDFPLALRQATVQQTAYPPLYLILGMLIKCLINKAVRQTVEFPPNMRKSHSFKLPH